MTRHLHILETLDIRFENPVAYVTLNRPEVRNAMNFQMVSDLNAVFTTLKDNRDIRVIVLSGANGIFCAGGDIKEMAVNSQNTTSNLDAMLQNCNQAAQIVIARIEGVALGGGFGLACVSDIAIASNDTMFGLPEVRLGIAPSVISPFVIQRIGLTRARELMLTGRRFDGTQAKEYGIITEACPSDEIDTYIESVLDEIRMCSPSAIATIKEILFTVADTTLESTVTYRAEMLDRLRKSDEGQEGMQAFIEKRPAKWVT